MRRMIALVTCVTALCAGAISARAAAHVDVIDLPCGGIIVTEFDDRGCLVRQWGRNCSGERWLKSYATRPRAADPDLIYNGIHEGFLAGSYYYLKFVYDPATGAVGAAWGQMTNGTYYEAVVE